MALDATVGGAESNSYVTVAFADAYFDARFNLDWLAAPNKEAVLIRATQYLDGFYRRRWKGVKADLSQALAWPRTGARDEDGVVVESDVIPLVVRQATCEAAVRLIEGDLQPDLDRGGMIKRQRSKVDVIEEEIEFMDGAPGRAKISVIDDLLSGLIRGGGTVWLDRV